MAQSVAPTPHVQAPYASQHKIRIVTAASLFDGHDAAINIMRRILQASGAEVIHLGHNRSVGEIVNAAIQEDAQAVAITSYQGGHVEYFKYMHDLLRERGAGHIKIFGGGGGTILPSEMEELHAYGIARIYSPDDGRAMGLQGMINDLLQKADFAPYASPNGEAKKLRDKDPRIVARAISYVENEAPGVEEFLAQAKAECTGKRVPVLGITGTGGAGKSSLTDELVRRFLLDFADKTVAILSVDPSKRKTGGALLGDRIRMNSIDNPRVFMRSFATREANVSISRHIRQALDVVKAAEYDLVIVETAGIGQSDSQITEIADACLYVMTPEFGAATQLEKIDMLDFADIVAINKFDKRGALDALRDVRKTLQRNQQRWNEPLEAMPAHGTMASQFNDPGTHRLYRAVVDLLEAKTQAGLRSQFQVTDAMSEKVYIIPPDRTRYLAEIGEESARYEKWVREQVALARQAWQVKGTLELVTDGAQRANLEVLYAKLWDNLHSDCRAILEGWPKKLDAYRGADYVYYVRGKEIRVPNYYESLAHTQIPKVALPRFEDWGEILRWVLRENVPGEFPFTAGVYPFKRTGEDPTRMFAGEGGPERTNRRFHYVSLGMPAARLSTAFDSVTLYGEDPATRPDIYGKIGNSGVSIASLNDAKKLYSGFDLCAPTTSVSMTINGPAPMLLAFFLNAAIDQECEKYIAQNGLTTQVNQRIAEIYLRRWMMQNAHAKYFDGPNGEVTITRETDLRWVENSNTNQAELEFTFDCLIPGPEGTGRDDRGHVLRTRENQVPGLDCSLVPWRTGLAIPRFLADYIPSYWGELPEGNTGLGLQLLGITGDKVLPPDVYADLKARALNTVRGTVQADILKEDQAQNTCIFSTEFALRMMGDIQAYFIDHQVRNFYSVSISGYHIAEAGANPITQLAFTLANGFTFVEYYLSRGMNINDFAPNLSFFFSNGMDPEYSVIGRVARRIWAKALRNKYGANERSQMLKYHIQTSGRSLHAQEIAFNDIRTTLQALYAIYDNCNSLHTNAYDEAITTPTEESVRRAMAIQLIINKELGLAKNENPIQGSYIIEELTDLVEEAVMSEFRRISDRGGVLGAMETMYQRNQIQEESMYYEMKKHTGEYPIVGVNTFLDKNGSPTIIPDEVIRSTPDEKGYQIEAIQRLHHTWHNEQLAALAHLQRVAVENGNVFEALMEAAKVCSLGQMTQALYAVGGQYRRNM